MSILIRQVLIPGQGIKDILIEGNVISAIGDAIQAVQENVIDGRNLAALPGFVNAHTHAGMTLMRGYADDLPVQEWLEQKIWPLENKLTEEDVYWGTKLACLEMIKTGTTFFNDMYWHFHATAQAVEEMGIRAVISAVSIDLFDEDRARQQRQLNEQLFRESQKYSGRIQFGLGPHAIYTVSPRSLRWNRDFAEANGCLIHTHLSETREEVQDCLNKHGQRPARYLQKIGFLGTNVIAAHCIWLDDEEIRILKDYDVKVVHNPTSNMKLSSGTFPYRKFRKAGISISLGTDGCASNNNLDMLEEMKFASVVEKMFDQDPTVMPAQEAFEMATKNGAEAFGLNAGEIAVGKLADIVLIDLRHPSLVPNHNLISNLVFSANGSVVDTTICDGKILMRHKQVAGEDEIIENAGRVARDLVIRS